MSAGARHRFGLSGDVFGVLYYDKETMRVAVELTTDKAAEGARPFKLDEYGASLRAKPFLDYFEVPVKGTMRMPLEKHPDTGWIIYDLKKARVRARERDEDGESDRGE